MFAVEPVRRRLYQAPLLLLAAASLSSCAHLWSSTLPELNMVPPPGSDAVDPRQPVVIEAKGHGVRLVRVDLQDNTGKMIPGKLQDRRFTATLPAAYGMGYRVRAVAENAFPGQRLRQEMQFRTLAMPVLEGPARRPLAADRSVTLRFDRPVGTIRPADGLSAEIYPDERRQTFRIVFPRDSTGEPFSVTLNWETSTRVALPPLTLELTAAPALKAEMNLQGRTEVGIALPLSLAFSAPLADRDRVSQQIRVQTADGVAVTGRWQWIDGWRLRFTPHPHWPPSSEVVVSAQPAGVRTVTGDTLESPTLGRFTTGPDRRIEVDLSGQRAVALERGRTVRTFRISTGKAATPTVTGTFYIYARFPLKTMRSDAKPGEPGHYVVENVPYAQYFYKDYALHGAWWHNGFGRPASHGCINMATRTRNRRWPNSPEDAGWLYEWASLGVPVTVYGKTPGL